MNTADINVDNYNYFLIVDLEATCCNDEAFPTEEMETIEIGAVMVEAKDLTVVDEFTIFIKPIRHPILTAFCTELTSITQADVDRAVNYPAAVDSFQTWLAPYKNFLFCSWGDYDRNQLQRDSALHGIAPPIDAPHLNIKKRFAATQKLRRYCGMARALRMAKLDLEGQHHRGIDDARNMAKLMPYILNRKKLSD